MSTVTRLPTPANPRDPLNVNDRLYKEISRLLDQLGEGGDDITIRERIAALVAIGRIQVLFMGLRKEKSDDPAVTGSAVRKYAGAFKAHDTRRRKKAAGGDAGPAPLDALFDEDDDDTAS